MLVMLLEERNELVPGRTESKDFTGGRVHACCPRDQEVLVQLLESVHGFRVPLVKNILVIDELDPHNGVTLVVKSLEVEDEDWCQLLIDVVQVRPIGS